MYYVSHIILNVLSVYYVLYYFIHTSFCFVCLFDNLEGPTTGAGDLGSGASLR